MIEESLFHLGVKLLLFQRQIISVASLQTYVSEVVFWTRISKELADVLVHCFVILQILKLTVHNEDDTSLKDVVVTQVVIYERGILVFSSRRFIDDLFTIPFELFQHSLCL